MGGLDASSFKLRRYPFTASGAAGCATLCSAIRAPFASRRTDCGRLRFGREAVSPFALDDGAGGRAVGAARASTPVALGVVRASRSHGGDTDTNAAICGALLGAVRARDAVTKRWVDTVLGCRPEEGRIGVRQPRPQCYWPVDALELAEKTDWIAPRIRRTDPLTGAAGAATLPQIQNTSAVMADSVIGDAAIAGPARVHAHCHAP
ncbi:MAG: ADP-ribosylglycohydrolase family protein [Gammaproteobacteria bacterium]|nr:ADP-ribosylglycohydrolase family protein [Gammaproteobacteria bacterium]